MNDDLTRRYKVSRNVTLQINLAYTSRHRFQIVMNRRKVSSTCILRAYITWTRSLAPRLSIIYHHLDHTTWLSIHIDDDDDVTGTHPFIHN